MNKLKKISLSLYGILVIFLAYRLISQTYTEWDGIIILVILTVGIILDLFDK